MNYPVAFKTDFKRNPYKGLYIALEGIDGSGKTVQEELLAAYFRKTGKEALVISEPRRVGMIGRVINEVLQKRATLPPVAIQYLFVADRVSHQEEVIFPALKNGINILSHRCFWSAIPYGMMDRAKTKALNYEVGEALLVAQSVLSMYYQITIPDITFYLKVSAETAIKRLKKQGIKSEHYETLEQLKRVQKGYDWMIKKFPKEFVVINGEQDPAKVSEDIINYLENYKK